MNIALLIIFKLWLLWAVLLFITLAAVIEFTASKKAKVRNTIRKNRMNYYKI